MNLRITSMRIFFFKNLISLLYLLIGYPKCKLRKI